MLRWTSRQIKIARLSDLWFGYNPDSRLSCRPEKEKYDLNSKLKGYGPFIRDKQGKIDTLALIEAVTSYLGLAYSVYFDTSDKAEPYLVTVVSNQPTIQSFSAKAKGIPLATLRALAMYFESIDWRD